MCMSKVAASKIIDNRTNFNWGELMLSMPAEAVHKKMAKSAQ
jgi:hypothetical protein